jgi:hypothetical protein
MRLVSIHLAVTRRLIRDRFCGRRKRIIQNGRPVTFFYFILFYYFYYYYFLFRIISTIVFSSFSGKGKLLRFYFFFVTIIDNI